MDALSNVSRFEVLLLPNREYSLIGNSSTSWADTPLFLDSLEGKALGLEGYGSDFLIGIPAELER